MKPERYDLIPVGALAKVAQLYGKGAEKYAEHNWRKGYEWSKSYAALQRHANEFWKGVDLDPETGLPHLAAVVFHAFTLITFMKEFPQFDDRFIGPKTELDTYMDQLKEQLLPADTVRGYVMHHRPVDPEPNNQYKIGVEQNHVDEEIYVERSQN